MDYSNIEFPKSVKQYNKIEQQNNINTNVFSYEEKQAFPIYVSRKKKSIMYSSKISRCSCITKQNVNTENTLARTVCNVSAVRRHLQTKNWLYRDKWKVGSKNAWKGNNTLKFNSSHKQLPVPFLIYADFEAITEKAHTCVPDNHESYTEAY